MQTGRHVEGLSVLLKFSFVADRGRRALTHFLLRDGALDEDDLAVIKKAEDFLDFTFLAQQLATGQTIQGFTPEKMKVREAAYEAAAAETLSSKEEFEFSRYLDEVRKVLRDLHQTRSAEKTDVEKVRRFLGSVRDHFQRLSAGPIEVVNQKEPAMR